MDILRGFTIEDPPIYVPWGMTEDELVRLFPSGALRHVTDGYYVASCTSLGGRRHELGFHFRPYRQGRLKTLEFFRDDASLSRTYPDWQRRLEAVLGPPDTTEPADRGYQQHVWRVGSVEVVHSVLDRFGPEEHVNITRLRLPPRRATPG